MDILIFLINLYFLLSLNRYWIKSQLLFSCKLHFFRRWLHNLIIKIVLTVFHHILLPYIFLNILWLDAIGLHNINRFLGSLSPQSMHELHLIWHITWRIFIIIFFIIIITLWRSVFQQHHFLLRKILSLLHMHLLKNHFLNELFLGNIFPHHVLLLWSCET
jgi:hypothetical protein